MILGNRSTPWEWQPRDDMGKNVKLCAAIKIKQNLDKLNNMFVYVRTHCVVHSVGLHVCTSGKVLADVTAGAYRDTSLLTSLSEPSSSYRYGVTTRGQSSTSVMNVLAFMPRGCRVHAYTLHVQLMNYMYIGLKVRIDE